MHHMQCVFSFVGCPDCPCEFSRAVQVLHEEAGRLMDFIRTYNIAAWRISPLKQLVTCTHYLGNELMAFGHTFNDFVPVHACT